MKETFEVRFEPVSWTTSDVKVLPTELYVAGEVPIDCPSQGNYYNKRAEKDRQYTAAIQ